MDCGVPFCHQGCPLGNLIPDWSDLVYRDQWKAAIERLHATNNFPEFTGKLCPAPCETACVLGLIDQPVAIKQIEESIVDRAWDEGWIVPQPPRVKTGRKVAVIGSGPAGLAAAQQLARAGHDVVVFERDDRIGGLLRYGIPDFKMEKDQVDRRVAQMEGEGVAFRPGVNVGVDLPVDRLLAAFDAVCLCAGATRPRDLDLPGREFAGIHFAMDYLTPQNRRVAGDQIPDERFLTAKGKDVIIIGGGDTGADCLGTVHRQEARSVHQFQIHPQPPGDRLPSNPWPQWSNVFRAGAAHEEGGRPRVLDPHPPVPGRSGQGHGPGDRPGRGPPRRARRPVADLGNRRDRAGLPRRPDPPGDRLQRARPRPPARRPRRPSRRPGQRPGRRRPPDQPRQGLRRRRHVQGPKPDRLGDRRRAPRRPRHRQVPDGPYRPPRPPRPWQPPPAVRLRRSHRADRAEQSGGPGSMAVHLEFIVAGPPISNQQRFSRGRANLALWRAKVLAQVQATWAGPKLSGALRATIISPRTHFRHDPWILSRCWNGWPNDIGIRDTP